MKSDSLPAKTSDLHTAEKYLKDLYIAKSKYLICEFVFRANFLRHYGIMYCLINEQECFIGFKTTRRSRVVLDPIKHDLRVY